MTILVTGAAGFIGSHLIRALARSGAEVVGVDSLNDYYDPQLKRARLGTLAGTDRFRFVELDLSHSDQCLELFEDVRPEVVVHLAAQAGVRYSLTAPHSYVSSNLAAFVNVLEAVRHNPVRHFLYASSSSVYGHQQKVPFAETDSAVEPVSLYAATKRSNELIAHSYCHLFGIRATGLRFFTVYGPWGRPDMAYYTFTRDILANRTIKLFNYGNQQRDFTYIDDIVEGLQKLIGLPPGDDVTPTHRVLNLGNSAPVSLREFVSTIETILGRTASIELVEAQPGDVPATFADTQRAYELTGFQPRTQLAVGLERFISWYRDYHQVSS